MARFHGWTAVLFALALSGCGGGSGSSATAPSGGGTTPPATLPTLQDPGDSPSDIVYAGSASQADVTTANAPRFADHAALLTLMTRALVENAGTVLFHTVGGVPSGCFEGGAGDRAADGTGWVRARLNACDFGNGMKWTGTVIYRVSTATNLSPTNETWTFATATLEYDGASYTFSGKFRRATTATGIEDTPAITLRNDATGKLFGGDGYSFRTSIGQTNLTVSGRIRDADWGYVETSTDLPVTMKNNRRGFVHGGALKLIGTNSSLWFIPASEQRVALALERPGATPESQSILLSADMRLEPQAQTPATPLFGAAAGPPQSLQAGKPFQLFGLFSGAEGRRWMSSSWKAVMVPPGSSAASNALTGVLPAFTPDLPGTYTFELTSSDGNTTSRDRVTHKVTFVGDDPVYSPPVSDKSIGAYLGPDSVVSGAITGTSAYTAAGFESGQVNFFYDLWGPDHRSIVSSTVALGAQFPQTSMGNPGFQMQRMSVSTDPGHSALRFFAFQQPLQYFRPAGFRVKNPGFGIAVADLFGTGHKDIVMTGYKPVTGGSTYGVFVIRNIAPGRYADPVFIEGGNAGAVVVGDFTGDGRPDIVLDAGGANIDLLAQLPDGNWAPPRRMHPAATSCPWTYNTELHPLMKADFDKDGRVDIAYASYCFGNTMLVVFFQNGDGTFTERVLTPETGAVYEGQLQAADVTGDGVPDLTVVAGPQTTIGVAHVDVYASRGDRTFAPLVSTPVSPMALEPFSFGVRAGAAGDYDGDGRTDILMSSPNGLFLFRQGPAGLSEGYRVGSTVRATWADVLASDIDFWIYEMRMVDIDGDGRQDVVVHTGRSGFYALSVFMQQPGGALAPPRALFPADGFGGAGSLPVALDENGDGSPDLYGNPPGN